MAREDPREVALVDEPAGERDFGQRQRAGAEKALGADDCSGARWMWTAKAASGVGAFVVRPAGVSPTTRGSTIGTLETVCASRVLGLGWLKRRAKAVLTAPAFHVGVHRNDRHPSLLKPQLALAILSDTRWAAPRPGQAIISLQGARSRSAQPRRPIGGRNVQDRGTLCQTTPRHRAISSAAGQEQAAPGSAPRSRSGMRCPRLPTNALPSSLCTARGPTVHAGAA